MMSSIVGLWRWRGNPLRRRSDSREAWLTLCAVLLIAVGAPLAGWFGSAGAHGALLRTVHEQQQARHQVWATARSAPRQDPLGSEPESSAPDVGRRHVVARWAGPDGSTHQSTVGTDHRVRPGDRFRIWTDAQGRTTSRPLTARTASSYAALAGLAVGTAAGASVEAGRRLTIRQLMRRRYLLWDAEWDRIGPDWGRTGSNS